MIGKFEFIAQGLGSEKYFLDHHKYIFYSPKFLYSYF